MTFKKIINFFLKTSSVTYFFYFIKFLINIQIIRLVSPEIFGSLDVVIAYLAIIDMTTTLPIHMGYINTKDQSGLKESALFLSYLMIPVKISAFLILVLILSFFHEIDFALMSLLFFPKVFVPLNTFLLSILDKNNKYVKSAIYENIASLLGSIICLMLLLYYQNNIYILALRESLPSLILLILLVPFITIKVQDRNKQLISDIFKYSIKVTFSRASEILFFKLPSFILSFLFNNAFVGLFNRAFYIINLYNSLMNVLTQKILFVVYSKNYNMNAVSNNKSFMKFNLFLFIISLPFSILLFLFSEKIILFLLGELWIEATLILKYLSPLIIFFPIFNNLKTYFYSIEKTSLVFYRYIAMSVIFTLICFLFVKQIVMSFIGIIFVIPFIVIIMYDLIRLKNEFS